MYTGGKALPEVGLLAEAVIWGTAGALHVRCACQGIFKLQLLRVAGRQPLQRPAQDRKLSVTRCCDALLQVRPLTVSLPHYRDALAVKSLRIKHQILRSQSVAGLEG